MQRWFVRQEMESSLLGGGVEGGRTIGFFYSSQQSSRLQNRPFKVLTGMRMIFSWNSLSSLY